MNPTRRSRRLIAAIAAGAMAIATVPLFGMSAAGAADPLPPVADPTGAGAFCDNSPDDNPFTDLGGESAATREVILCLVATELTAGTTATTYSPGDPVTRRQMALFIKRLADDANELEIDDLQALPAYDGSPDHSDIGAEKPAFEEAIGQLTQAEIVGGFPDGTYRPDDTVSRRQMAAFINRLQAYLTGTPFVATGDYFDDDNGDTGEANLNALAEVGIFQGDGEGNVFPGADISRRQMANILLRHAQVNFADGLIESPFEAPPADGIDITPTSDVQLDLDAQRSYTASNLDDDSVYRVTLVDSTLIEDRTTEPKFTPTTGACGDTVYANPGPPEAALTSINGAVVTPTPDHSQGGIEPQNGNITLVLTGAGDTVETVVPVVYVDNGATGCTLLELDENDEPIETFAIGGEVSFVPEDEAAPVPPLVSGDVLFVGDGYFVADPGSGPVRYNYDNSDSFTYGGAGASFSIFDAAISTSDDPATENDAVDTVSVAYSTTLPNSFDLTADFAAKPGPISVSNVGDQDGDGDGDDATFSWTAPAPLEGLVVTYEVGIGTDDSEPDEPACTTVTGLTDENGGSVDDDEGVDGSDAAPYSDGDLDTSLTVFDLPDGDLCAHVRAETQHNDGGATNSEWNEFISFTTSSPAAVAPTITSAEVNDVPILDNATTGDTITLVFSESMDPDSVDGATFTVLDADNDVATIFCGESDEATDTDATCVLGEGDDDDTLTITLDEDGFDQNGNGGNDAIEYPLEITATDGITDLNAGLEVDVDGSADTEIS